MIVERRYPGRSDELVALILLPDEAAQVLLEVETLQRDAHVRGPLLETIRAQLADLGIEALEWPGRPELRAGWTP